MSAKHFSRSFPIAILLLVLPGCSRHQHREVAYVSAPQAVLRDQVANVYNKMGVVKNGERVEVLDRDRRFVQVRTAAGVEGWVEQRYLVNQQVYDAFGKLVQQEQADPIQGTAVARNETNLHITPERDSEHLYQVAEGARVSILRRATSEKILPGEAVRAVSDEAGNEAQEKPAPKPVMEDWWLVRDAQNHVGWVLGRMVDVDIPLDVATYAEGERIVASFVLDEVADGDKKIPQYLVLLTEPKDGMPYDYDQVRVFTWNVRRHRYETAYHERNLNGVLPVTVSQETLEKQRSLPVFVLRVKDDSGNIVEKKYQLNTPIVRRVYAPGEEPAKSASSRGRKKH
jgi:uncharacterized protein YgiM (DUF1202 family)